MSATWRESIFDTHEKIIADYASYIKGFHIAAPTFSKKVGQYTRSKFNTSETTIEVYNATQKSH